MVSLYNTLACVSIERIRRREGVKEGREGRREREIPKEIPIKREEAWRVSWGGEKGSWRRGRRRLEVMKRQEMKEGRRVMMGWEGTKRQSMLARRRTRVGSAVAEPFVRKWISPAGRGATEAAVKM